MKYDFARIIKETAWIEEPFMRKYRAPSYPSKVDEFELSEASLLIKDPFLSIVILIYNKEPFLRECVNSILNQKTEFSYEIILAEDCSTDRSRDLCFELQRAYPDKIRVVYASANVGVMKNTIRGMSKCRGRFAACIDGDDYYASKDKIQNDVSYLVRNSDCVLTYSASFTQYEHYKWLRTPASVVAKRTCLALEKLSVADMSRSILKNNPITTISPVFRREAGESACGRIQELYNVVDWFPCQDFELWFFIAALGGVHYNAKEQGTYRLCAGALTAADDITSYARILGDVRNKLAIVHIMGDGYFSTEEQEYWVQTFKSSLQNYCALIDDFDIDSMPYVKALCGDILSEKKMSSTVRRLSARRMRWALMRTPVYFFVKKIVLMLQNALLRAEMI